MKHQKIQASVFQIQSTDFNQFLNNPSETQTWQHQIDATKEIKEHLESCNTALCVLPTGSGKTGISVLSAYAMNYARVLIITPSKQITDQMFQAFSSHSFLVRMGILKDDETDSAEENFHKYFEPSCSIIDKTDNDSLRKYLTSTLIITNAHKLGLERSNAYKFDLKPDLIIIDEAHHYPSSTWKNIVDAYKDAKKIFFTATPVTRDGGPILENQEDCKCYEIEKQDLVDGRYIRDYEFLGGDKNKGKLKVNRKK
jgi:superfamily II DNA or RNA helicase